MFNVCTGLVTSNNILANDVDFKSNIFKVPKMRGVITPTFESSPSNDSESPPLKAILRIALPVQSTTCLAR